MLRQGKPNETIVVKFNFRNGDKRARGEREGETKPEADTDTDDREREGSIKSI